MGGSPGDGFGGPPTNIHIGPDQSYGGQQQQPSNAYQGTAAQQQHPSNVYQGSSPYNLQSVTDGMASMLPPSSASSSVAPATPHMGSITQFATPPPQQQQQQTQQPNAYAPSQPQATAASSGSYAARSAMARAGTVASSATPQTTAMSPSPQQQHHAVSPLHNKQAHDAAQQNRILTDATRKVQEHAYYMKQAMDRDDLPTVLDRASHMVGELGRASQHAASS